MYSNQMVTSAGDRRRRRRRFPGWIDAPTIPNEILNNEFVGLCVRHTYMARQQLYKQNHKAIEHIFLCLSLKSITIISGAGSDGTMDDNK